MKQSIGLVILQILGIVVGVFSVFYIAGSLPPEVYAVVGIYTVISSFISVFSNTGIETQAIRNVLLWKEENKNDLIKLIVTQSLVYRGGVAILLIIPIIGYSYYVSSTNFNGQYLDLFILMAFMSVFKAVNDSAALLLRSFNLFFISALASYSVNVFGRLIALLLFFQFGFLTYIYFILLLPLLVTVPVVFILRRWISFRGVFVKENLIETVKSTKSFAFSAYLSYLFNYFDQLLVSIFMSPEILGSFSVAKSLLNISKKFIENLFDPIIQGVVKFKNNTKKLTIKLRYIYNIQKIVLLVSFTILPFILFFIEDLLSFINLASYKYLTYFVCFIYLSQIVNIALKVKYYLVTLFFPQAFYLKLTALSALLVVFFFAVISILDMRLLFLHLVLKNTLILFYCNFIYSKYSSKFIFKDEICT